MCFLGSRLGLPERQVSSQGFGLLARRRKKDKAQKITGKTRKRDRGKRTFASFPDSAFRNGDNFQGTAQTLEEAIPLDAYGSSTHEAVHEIFAKRVDAFLITDRRAEFRCQ